MTPPSVLIWIIMLITYRSAISQNVDSNDEDIAISTTTSQPKICNREVLSNITCPAGKYVTSKCLCATCIDFGETCFLHSQCCQSSHMSCRKFTELPTANCLCDESYVWDAYTASCFLPANVPQQMLMITLYSFIAMFTFVGILFTLAHFCDFSLCGRAKPRYDYESGDLNFFQEPETRSNNRDLPPSYSQLFSTATLCPQDAMVNAGLDLALPLYSQVVGLQDPRYQQEEQVTINDSRQLITNHQVQLHTTAELPPAYEEQNYNAQQVIYSITPCTSSSLLPVSLENIPEESEPTCSNLQVPTIIITPSETMQDLTVLHNNCTDDPDLVTPPAALLQVPQCLELSSLNIESTTRIIDVTKQYHTKSSNIYKPVFVSTMNIILENSSSNIESLKEDSSDEKLSENLDYSISEVNEATCMQNLDSRYHNLTSLSIRNHDTSDINPLLFETKNMDRYMKTQNICNDKSLNSNLTPTYVNDKNTDIVQSLPETSSNPFLSVEIDMKSLQNKEGKKNEKNMPMKDLKMTSTQYNENCSPSNSKMDDISLKDEDISTFQKFDEASSSSSKTRTHFLDETTLGSKLFRFDYAKFCNFERSNAANVAFQPTVETDSSSYTSPACQM